MKLFSKNFAIIFLVLSLWIIPVIVSAQTVLIWDNDNNSDFIDPEGAGNVGCEYGLQHALTANGITHTTVSALPTDLSGYDVVFITLGIYCVG